MINERDHFFGYQILRFLATNLVAHGLARFPQIKEFVGRMSEMMQPVFVPDFMVRVFAYALPGLEFIAGILLLFGVLPRVGLMLWGLAVVILTFGTCMLQKWGTAQSLAFYGFITYVVYRYAAYAVPVHKLFSFEPQPRK